MSEQLDKMIGKLSGSIDDFIPEPKHSVFRKRQKEEIKKIKESLEPAEKPTAVRLNGSHYSTVTGRFQIFRVIHGKDVIFVIDNERCCELDLQAVHLDGRGGSAICRIINIGVVEGKIRSDAPIYIMDKECLGLRRVNGNLKTLKESQNVV
jgi:hypothetical protein